MDPNNIPEIDPAFDELGEAPKTQPADTAAPITPINEQALEWQAQTDAAVESALLALPEVIAGVTLFPFTTARGSLLRRIGNEFVQGVKIESIADPFLSVGRFLTIMSLPLAEARRMVTKPEELEERAYDILDTISLGDVSVVVGQVNGYVKRAMANQVHGTPQETEGESAVPPGPKN